MAGTLQVIVSFVKVLLLDFDFSDLIQSRTSKMIVVIRSDHLLKVEDRIAEIVELLQGFCFVKVGLAQSSHRLIVALGNLGQLVEVL